MIKITLKSYFIFKIKSFLLYFINNIKKKYSYIGPFFMPRKIEKFTILISPHVDKHARDQIQIKYFKVILYIKKFDIKLLNFLFKNKYIDGIHIKYNFL
ncbi:uS10/mL48 family ribosomal protein [Candidatus Carsonella ruddii]|uniref:US10/mL48 family ribosomal protein n=1 Tax=Carsonella ruddii TaxID=114186 RepID=A0AAJ6FBH1_CARRU|nr:uS10/mL48 family ribosomal protein [Candidatus Carsonella ruddii]WGS66644.1 uS10/mL48 family ribosomal protein [Candidatus Carsonella ruddii]WGS66840.1 uS10/mL48 family ribosomal protein [Candidatus Carsonella ruddii]WGS67032.1 uS10/mL48 family ribosomal protein [Candidatus Carsonella ruddii]WGS67224.1 uS10/mL48 family ribosomal protein [Candidatus Carsonella ruddii]WMC18241.1 MAG: uS10/mL48 family ribosomal protein [Candidatus Carsonella ruddii]